MSSKNHPKVVSLSKLTKFRLFLLYSFPATLFCSYFPLFPISSTASTNYELSLALIWLFLFSVLSLKDFVKHLYNIRKSPLRLLFYLFPTYLLASSLWSINLLRAILTTGIFWCLIISAVAILTSLKPYINKLKFQKIFLVTSAVFCAVCWLQSILDVAGIDRSVTLLCSGCTSLMFGFPHPSGFAIEPQFMGNLLLVPTFLSLYLWIKSNKKSYKYPLSTFLFSSTLFLTFSRGAIYAFVGGFIFFFVFQLTKPETRKIWKALPLLLTSAVFVLLVQGVFSAISPTDSTFLGGIEKSISQMTLGKVNLSLEPKTVIKSNAEETATEIIPNAPVFSGYVEESTDTRMNFNRIALELAPRSTDTLMFGYGLGSAGEIMYREGKTDTPFEIIQNEYLSLLLETGLVGLLLATVSAGIIIFKLRTFNRLERQLLEAIALSFAITLLFFSGLPNALHIYLFPTFLAVILPTPPRNQSSRKLS